MSVDAVQPLSAVQAWVRSTCAAQGIPERISDTRVLGEVVTLLLPGRSRANTGTGMSRTRGPGALLAPVGHDAVGVEPMSPRPNGGKDSHVVEDGLDDGDLAGEVQVLPLSA